MTVELRDFLLARIVEDEGLARRADPEVVDWLAEYASDAAAEFNEAHIKRWAPGHALDALEGLRAAVHRPDGDWCEGCGGADLGWGEMGYAHEISTCPTLRALAVTYRWHPGYRAEWAPEAARA